MHQALFVRDDSRRMAVYRQLNSLYPVCASPVALPRHRQPPPRRSLVREAREAAWQTGQRLKRRGMFAPRKQRESL